MESQEITYLYNLHLLAFSVETPDPSLNDLAALDLRRVKNYFKGKRLQRVYNCWAGIWCQSGARNDRRGHENQNAPIRYGKQYTARLSKWARKERRIRFLIGLDRGLKNDLDGLTKQVQRVKDVQSHHYWGSFLGVITRRSKSLNECCPSENILQDRSWIVPAVSFIDDNIELQREEPSVRK